jgi:uncharacterized membrane protein (DUF106 family)
VSALNALLRAVFDVILLPFSGLPPLVGLTLVSLATAIALLLTVKVTSNQDGIAAVKRKIHACLFEIRLFNDDLVAILRAQLEILGHNATYLRLSMVPVVWIIVPLTLVIAQLQFHYGYRGLEPGEKVLFKVEFSSASGVPGGGMGQGKPSITLDLPDGLRGDSPGIWIPSKREMTWRLEAQARGEYEVGVNVAGGTYVKNVQVSSDVKRRSPVRLEPGFLNLLLYPAEASLPRHGPLASITVEYPEVDVPFPGFGLHWMIVYFILSMVFAFALRNRLGVTI